MGISGKDVIPLLSDLVAIDSVNPSLVPGAAGEGEIARYVDRWMARAGLETRLIDVAPGRPNAIGRVPGSGGGPALMLNAHMDTVGTAGMDLPFQPRVDGERLYGRGAYDMKGSLAAILLAGQRLAAGKRLRGDVVIAAVMDEEYSSLGTQAIIGDFPVDAAIVTEPTGLRICAAHKGFAWITVETRGRAAHGSRPDLGVDAIALMSRVLHDLEELQRSLVATTHPLLGSGSLHASLIEGGQELSSYPERCVLRLERRTIPGETPEGVLAEIETILARQSQGDLAFSAAATLDLWREPFEVSAGEGIVRAVQSASVAVLEREPRIYGDTPWMDAALLQAAGIPTAVFGPGGAGAHAIEEYSCIPEVAACAEILVRTAEGFCGLAG